MLPDDSSMDGGDGSPGTTSFHASLRTAGYRTVSHLSPGTRLAVANHANEDLLRWVRAGGDYIAPGMPIKAPATMPRPRRLP